MDKDKKKAGKNLEHMNLTNAQNRAVVVKVPKYVAQKWESAPSDINAGKLTVIKTPGQKPIFELSLPPEVVELKPEGKIPTEYTLQVSNVNDQTYGVFSTEASEQLSSGSEKISMEGCIVKKIDCKPQINDSYVAFKREAVQKASESRRTVYLLDKVVPQYKPVTDHAHNIEYRNRKKAEGKKARDDKNFVMGLLFNAFEKHQYYHIKDLVKITKQPIAYLKEILKEICNYNMKNPHKKMWELKKGYCHYKSDEKEKDEQSNADSESE
ncbi:general transcription factor IIF subunit 2-like [Teleopsis dalmanni]|uniref:general transcription factor IIF subunit 2-like n=1 Tax=Teleopsis dalmanni TaxID=139649 RepID=UPI0018CCBD3F|nr:general transcription factor IIF subunit 2-like [Teleopsis dalmanni]